MANYAIMPLLRGVGFNDRNFWGIFLGKELILEKTGSLFFEVLKGVIQAKLRSIS